MEGENFSEAVRILKNQQAAAPTTTKTSANATRPTRIQPTGDAPPPLSLLPPRFVVVVVGGGGFDVDVFVDVGVGLGVGVGFIGVSVGVNDDISGSCVVGLVGPARINEGKQ